MKDKIDIRFNENGGYKLEANLSCATYKEDDTFISICPTLKITTQGDTEEESMEMLKEAVELFLGYWAISRKQLPKALEELGWKIGEDALSIDAPKLKQNIKQMQHVMSLA